MNPLEKVRAFWVSLFNEKTPSPSIAQVTEWLNAYGVDGTIAGLKITAGQHIKRAKKNNPMTFQGFIAYATAVMRNRSNDSALPVPSIYCDACGRSICESPEPESPAKKETIQ